VIPNTGAVVYDTEELWVDAGETGDLVVQTSGITAQEVSTGGHTGFHSFHDRDKTTILEPQHITQHGTTLIAESDHERLRIAAYDRSNTGRDKFEKEFAHKSPEQRRKQLEQLPYRNKEEVEAMFHEHGMQY